MADKGKIEIDDEHLPAMFIEADRASINAQAKYLKLIKADLGFLAIGALLASLSPQDDRARTVILAIGAAFLLVSTVLTIIIRWRQYERIWYGARAIAESVKTLAWQYMTCAEPFESNLPVREADRIFGEQLLAIHNERKNLAWAMTGDQENLREITPRMREVRNQSVHVRTEVYKDQRIKEQRQWYRRKSRDNKNLQEKWFWGIIATQSLACLSSFLIILIPSPWINPTGLISTIAASFWAWLQIKRHQELAQSYAVASHELGIIATKAEHVTSDKELSELVGDAENAISREHTLWVARRDQV